MKFKICLLFLLLGGSLFAQKNYTTKETVSKEALKFYQEGRNLGDKNAYEKALEKYEKALEIAPDFIDAYLFVADAHYALDDFAQAEAWFLKVVALDETYNLRVLYVLASLQYRMDKFAEAATHLARFLTYPSKSPKLTTAAERLLINCNFAAEAVKNPLPFKPQNLTEINTETAEYLPCFTADGKTMIYTSRYVGQEDFFIAYNIDGKWTAGMNMGAPINTMDNEGAQTISADGRFLVYTVCNRQNDYGACDLYYAEKINGAWSQPYNIEAPINTRGWESQPALSPDGQTLFFTANREGGKGNKDIWVTYRMSNGKWTMPENLGDSINTAGNEQSPFMHADGQTLYFCSDTHAGMGGTDLFMSVRKPDGSWSKPRNLGYPINTKADEGSLVVSLDGRTGYFASDRTDSKGALDIYSFEMPESIRPKPVTYLQATVLDAETGKPLVAKVELVQLSTGLTYTTSMTTESGEFLICLPAGDDYALNVTQKGYLFYSENFELQTATAFDEPFEAKVALQKIPLAATNTNGGNATETSKPVILKNVFFESGSAALKPSSKTELLQLVKLLNDNSTVRIQINGHTDNVGDATKNQELSLARATAVRQYLIEKGIAADRITAKGFGESLPIDSNDTLEGRSRNRRTEFVMQ